MSVRRNEIQGKIAPRTVTGWMREPGTAEPYKVDSAGRESADGQNRTQRNSLLLRDVAYLIEASVAADVHSPRRPADQVSRDGSAANREGAVLPSPLPRVPRVCVSFRTARRNRAARRVD